MYQFQEVNLLNQNRKNKFLSSKTLRHLENKFYIYNGGIHQIVSLHTVGFSGVEIEIQKPSGKYTQFTTTSFAFSQRKIFDTFDEAAVYLLNIWRNENEVPRYRSEYIKELEDKYTQN